MTLNLMLINRSGIWQSSDLRLFDPRTRRLADDFSVKHVTLRCTDGTAVIAYTGIGATRNVHISDWVRQILRGESRTVDQSLILLRDRATEDLGPIVDGCVPHIFTIGAFLSRQPWAAQIRNFDVLESRTWGPPKREFSISAKRIQNSGQHFALGTPDVVLAKDMATLARVANVVPRTPRDFRKLLAAVNRRASKTPIGSKFVSPHCVTTYVPPAGEPCEQEVHDVNGSPTPVVMPFLLFGIDMTDVTRSLQLSLKAKQGVDPIQAERAGLESVVPRNPLRRK